jgi:hypothetical protein
MRIMGLVAVLFATMAYSAKAATPSAVRQEQPDPPLKAIDLPVERAFAGDVGQLLRMRVHIIVRVRGIDRSRVSVVLENVLVTAVDAKAKHITLLVSERDDLRLALARQLGPLILKPWPWQPPAPQPGLSPQPLPPRPLPPDIG